MTLQKQPNCWSCAPTALAMLLGLATKDVVEQIGHDGSEIWWPGAGDPLARRGYHFQELNDVALTHGYGLVEVQMQPASINTINGPARILPLDPDTRFDTAVRRCPALITGLGKNHAHWLAWSGTDIYDPTGIKYPLRLLHLAVQSVFLLAKVG